jgi:hypothetical protein
VLPLTRLSLSGDRAELDAVAAWIAVPSFAMLCLLDLGNEAARLVDVSASDAERRAVSKPRFLMTSLGSSRRMAFSSSLSLSIWRYQLSSWLISASDGSAWCQAFITAKKYKKI